MITLEFRKKRAEQPAIAMNPDEILVLFVRHGISAEDLENRYCGWTDSPMVQEGREQMATAKQIISGIPYGPIYTDDLQRTGASAAILAEGAANPEIIVMKQFRPWGIGTKLSEQIKTKSNERLVQFYVEHPNDVPDGDQAESINESIARWNSGFGYVLSQMKPGMASVVSSHSNAHKILRAQFLGQKYKGDKKLNKFKLGHGGVMAFRLRKDGNAVIEIVHQGWLEEDQRSTQTIWEIRNATK